MKMLLIGHTLEYEMSAMVTMFTGDPPKLVQTESELDEDYIKIIKKDAAGAMQIAVEFFCSGELQTAHEELEETAPDALKLALGRLVYRVLSRHFGTQPPWGVLTGVRPVKLFHQAHAQGKRDEQIATEFAAKYLIKPEKIELALKTRKNEDALLKMAKPNEFSLFISIPFCPSRCSYCSFVSHSIERTFKLIDPYIDCMVKELAETAKAANACGLKLKTVYIGGGTPTILSPLQLEKLLEAVSEHFNLKNAVEYTVEAGRPDTFTAEKLHILKAHGVDRISINPQTFNNDVLKEIGRNHTAEDVLAAYEMANRIGFKTINMDFIAGLPTESMESFVNSMQKALILAPQNITVHTLSYKRSARNQQGKAAGPQARAAAEMLSYMHATLQAAGYLPYYLYRQKNMLANLENTGYTIPGRAGLYNALMMDDSHTVLAVGAGAVTKLFDENAGLERIFNFKYPYEYLDAFEQIIKRKINIYNFFLGKQADKNL